MCVVTKIKHIECYATYRTIIDGCREAARMQGCDLIELEQFAGLGILPGDDPQAMAVLCKQADRGKP